MEVAERRAQALAADVDLGVGAVHVDDGPLEAERADGDAAAADQWRGWGGRRHEGIRSTRPSHSSCLSGPDVFGNRVDGRPRGGSCLAHLARAQTGGAQRATGLEADRRAVRHLGRAGFELLDHGVDLPPRLTQLLVELRVEAPADLLLARSSTSS